ncbi:MAG: hypothetical protein HY559_02045 [Gammaproteobacteria bacterium]|nr:hypothetical protein [Gammaproteobacteria bacterium]
MFKELKNKYYFNQVKAIQYVVEWPNQQDFSADTLYLCSKSKPRRKQSPQRSRENKKV